MIEALSGELALLREASGFLRRARVRLGLGQLRRVELRFFQFLLRKPAHTGGRDHLSRPRTTRGDARHTADFLGDVGLARLTATHGKHPYPALLSSCLHFVPAA